MSVFIPKVNDLVTAKPTLAAEWHPTKNGELQPFQVAQGSHARVWWLGKCGHEWKAQILSRSRGCGCPICDNKVVLAGFNDLATKFPDIVLQWHPTKNGNLRPDNIAAYSNKKVWWICEKGHEYQSEVGTRTKHGKGCPYCAGRKVLPGFNDLATLKPKIAKQWHPSLNGDLTPEMVSVGSNKYVWWVCSFGHVWKSVIYSRTSEKGAGCPICAKLN